MAEKREERQSKHRHRQQKKKPSKTEIPHVRLSSQVDEVSICCDNEFYGVTEKSNENFYPSYMKEAADDEYNKKFGNDNGSLLNRNQVPKDEAALLQQGLINRSGFRFSAEALPVTSTCSPSRSCSEKSKKKKSTTPQKELITSTSSPSLKDETFGTIRCDAGHGADTGNITYSVTKDGRNYELTTNAGYHVYLEFSKKHAYLVCD